MVGKIFYIDNGNHFRKPNHSVTDLLMYICICKGIKESDVRELGQAGITCPRKLADALELNDKRHCCGRCIKNISKFVAITKEEASCRHIPIMS